MVLDINFYIKGTTNTCLREIVIPSVTGLAFTEASLPKRTR